MDWECILAVSIVLYRSGELTAKRITGPKPGSHVVWGYSLVLLFYSSPHPVYSSPPAKSCDHITCRRLPVPCWQCGSYRVAFERSWGSRGWGFVRSLPHSHYHSFWSVWSSAWHHLWIAVKKLKKESISVYTAPSSFLIRHVLVWSEQEKS